MARTRGSEAMFVEVTGNDGTARTTVAKNFVKRQHPGAVIVDVAWYGRSDSGNPVYRVEYEEAGDVAEGADPG